MFIVFHETHPQTIAYNDSFLQTCVKLSKILTSFPKKLLVLPCVLIQHSENTVAAPIGEF